MSFFIKTPLILSHELSLLNSISIKDEDEKTNVFLKLDNLQPSGSFKVRGIGYLADEKREKESADHLISPSGGNAGLATAYVAQKLNMKATIVVPTSVLPSVVDKLRSYQAEVIIHGNIWDESNEEALRLVSQTKSSVYISPFDHHLIWKGNSSIISELEEQLDGIIPDCIIASVGGGGLMCGIIEGCIRNGWIEKDIKIVAVETIGCDCFNQSTKQNKLITLDDITSIAKSLGAKTCCSQLLEYYKMYKDKIESIVVRDEDVVKTIGKFLDQHRILVEPACAASITVAYNVKEYISNRKFKNIVVEMCGGSSITLENFLNYKKMFNYE